MKTFLKHPFTVSRVSQHHKDKETPPCENAVLETLLQVDSRRWLNPKEENDWYQQGINHRIENDRICRDFPRKIWIIQFKNDKEFMQFLSEHEPVILHENRAHLKEPLWHLEIYDDYLE